MRWLVQVTFVRLALLLGLVIFFVYSPYDLRERARKIRERRTAQSSTPMEIAVVWPQKDGHMFIEGAATAVQEINDHGGITIADDYGNPVKTPMVMHVFDEFQDRDTEKVAARVVKNLDLSAVIGHTQPDSAIRASITYQDSGLVYVSPAVSDAQLLHHDFWGCVQTVPDDAAISRAMVSFALSRGWHKAAILYVRNTYGATYEKFLRQYMGELSARERQSTNRASTLDLRFQSYYAEDERSFYLLISSLLDAKCDVVFLCDSLLGAAASRTLILIDQLREMGVKQPIVGSEELHSTALWPALGQKANDVFALNIFDLHSFNPNPIAREFRSAFRKTYTTPPSMHAGEGYEAVLLLAQAAERARSKVPLKMATMFKSTFNWNGLQGEGGVRLLAAGWHREERSFHGAVQGRHLHHSGGSGVAPRLYQRHSNTPTNRTELT
jgi:branched-chain amino acid transport system substrate-binding protein